MSNLSSEINKNEITQKSKAINLINKDDCTSIPPVLDFKANRLYADDLSMTPSILRCNIPIEINLLTTLILGCIYNSLDSL